jgi:hypothetical protein
MFGSIVVLLPRSPTRPDPVKGSRGGVAFATGRQSLLIKIRCCALSTSPRFATNAVAVAIEVRAIAGITKSNWCSTSSACRSAVPIRGLPPIVVASQRLNRFLTRCWAVAVIFTGLAIVVAAFSVQPAGMRKRIARHHHRSEDQVALHGTIIS